MRGWLLDDSGRPSTASVEGVGQACGHGIQPVGRRVGELRPQTSVDVSDHRTGQALTHRPLLPALVATSRVRAARLACFVSSMNSTVGVEWLAGVAHLPAGAASTPATHEGMRDAEMAAAHQLGCHVLRAI